MPLSPPPLQPGERCAMLVAGLALVVAAGVPAASAQPAVTKAASVQGSGVALRSERARGFGRAPDTKPADSTSFARAQKIDSDGDDRVVLEGNAEVRANGSVLRADRIIYTRGTDTMEAAGNVRVFQDGVLFTGPQLRWQLDAQTGTMPDVKFSYAPRQVGGTAALLEVLEPGRSRFHDAVYSSCTPPDMAWWVRAEKLDVDRDEQLAEVRNGTLYFMDLPIFASPYFQFPIGDQRRSGLLTPNFGFSSRLGFEATAPWYWNIAPNRDATVAPRLMTQRGLMLQNEFRYLEPTLRGRIQYDVLPEDRATGTRRDLISTQHEWNNRAGLAAGLNYNRVSDDRYFSDFGANIVAASQSILPQEGYLAYNQTYYNAALRITRNQTLQDPLAPVTKPYERVPQITFNALDTNWRGFDVRLAAEAVRFTHPTLEKGDRLIVNPSVAYPWMAPGWFVIPKVQWHATRYELDDALRPGAASPTRSLPIASLDAGLIFDRDTTLLGRATTQTLEPRLFYSYMPYREQNNLPNFDSGLADFNFAQLFTENQFVGGDRIAEADQLTAALVTRLIDSESGTERLRAAIGQRFYNTPQRVALPDGLGARTDQSSDLLLALSGRLSRSWITDVAVQHSTLLNQVVRASVGVRYQPRPASVLSLAYRYKINEIEQYDMAVQWPIASRWYGVGRANYSTRDRSWIELLGGFEYKADCWAARFAVQRFLSATNTYTKQVFFAIEFNGLGSVGAPPNEVLRRNIPGYQSINPPPARSGRFDNYE
ncbi:MAG: LPS-assembly protein LptD [Betaproteobacteria bacterium]